MRLVPLGDAAVLIELGRSIDPVTHAYVRAAFRTLSSADIDGVTDIVPAYTGVAVHYDPTAFADVDTAPFDHIAGTLTSLLSALYAAPEETRRVVDISVHYGGHDGPDLEHVARHTNLSAQQVVELHASVVYTVHMIGFTPGFPYLGGLPPQLATPRRAAPRAAVRPGSVGIAGMQTGIYPLETPGGWQIIGRTSERLFRPEEDPPTLLRMGDHVRFVPVQA